MPPRRSPRPVPGPTMDSVPLAGIDGTMRKRLNGNGVAGQAHVKTGYLDGVRGGGWS